MRIINHGLKSLIRKPVKAIMIFAILLVVYCLVFTGIIIDNSITESKRYVRTELGAVVEYKADYERAYNEDEEFGMDEDDWKKLWLYTSVAEEIAKDEAVEKLYLINYSGMISHTLKSENNGWYDDMSGESEVYLDLMGSNQSIPIEFVQGGLALTEGDYYTQEDINAGKYVALMSQELALENDLSVGDTFQATTFKEDEEEITFEIAGIYEGSQEYDTARIFVPLSIINELNAYYYEMEPELEEEDIQSTVYFLLNDPLEIERFIEEHQDDLRSEYTVLDGNDSKYKSLTKPLDLISTITNLLIVVVFVAGAIIILAITFIFVRDRKFEIGLLLANGESKFKIIIQFILEILVVAILAFIISVFVSQLSSGLVSDWLTDTQIVDEEESEYDDYYYYSYGIEALSGDISLDNIAEEFDVSISLETILTLFALSIVLLLVAASIPLLIILSFKPREALQD